MKKSILVLLLLAFCIPGMSQVVIVKDEITRKPIENVAVYDKNQSIAGLTDQEGKAYLPKAKDNDTIIFQHPSYEFYIIAYKYLRKDKTVYMTRKSVNLNEVVISANKWEQQRTEVPNKILRMDMKQISFDNPQTTADLLSESHQIFVQKSQLGGGSPMIRGFSANSLLIVVDGVRMNNAIYRSGNLQNVISIDANSIENAEVIFGPGSVIYGSDALGGVMDFHLLEPKISGDGQFKFSGNFMTRYSSADNEKTAHLDFQLAMKKWSFLTSLTMSSFGDLKMGEYMHDDYLRKHYAARINGKDVVVDNQDPRIQKFSAYDQFNVMQKVRFKPDRKIDLTYGFYYSGTSDVPRYDRLIQYSNDTTLTYAEWYYGPQKWMMNSLQARISSFNKIFDEVKITLAYQDYEESRYSRKFNKDNLRTQIEQLNIYSANFDFDKKVTSSSFLYYGAEAVLNNVNSSAYEKNIVDGSESPAATRYPDGSNDYLTLAAYLSYKMNFTEKFTAIAGARYSYVSLSSTIADTSLYHFPYNKISLNTGALNGSLGFTYRPRTGCQFNLNFSSGFRAPNLDDIGKVFDSEPGNVIVPNKDLKPEYAYNAELGWIREFEGKLKFELDLFYTFLVDAMVRRPFTFDGKDSINYDGELSRVEALVNAGSANIYGGSFSFDIKLNSMFSLISGITYTRGEDEDGYAMRHIAPLFGNTTIRYFKKGVRIDLSANYNGEISYENLAPSERSKTHMYAKDKDGKPYSPSWWSLNLKSSYPLTDVFTVDFGIENILNVRYRPYSSGIVAPGRNIFVVLRARL